MALFEMWSTQWNENQDSNPESAPTCMKSVLPGTFAWIKKSKPKLFLPVQKIPANKNRLFGKNKGAIFKKAKITKTKSNRNNEDPPVETAHWQLVRVLSRSGNHITVSRSQGLRVIDLEKSKETCLPHNQYPVDDMTELHHAHMPAILYNLKARAMKKQPCTFIGNVLVSINPLRDVDSDFTVNPKEEYQPPHPRTVAERAFMKMSFAASQQTRLADIDADRNRQTKLAPSNGSLINPASKFAKQFGLVNQSIVISGESGSGKTEAAKRVLAQLVEREHYNEFSDIDDPGVYDFQDNLIGTDPILESFGNARTQRNPNSSRFGKFLKLWYDVPEDEGEEIYDENNGYYIDEASITTYLLERSRVTYQDKGEGNFRIFYQLLTAPNDSLHQYLGFSAAGLKFNYLNSGFTRSHHDRVGYRSLRIALRMVKLRVRSLRLFEIVAAVLHIGNIEFEEEDTSEGAVATICDPFKNLPVKKKPVDKGTKNVRKRFANSFASFTSVNKVDKLRKETMLSTSMNVRKDRKNTAATALTNFTAGSDKTVTSEKTVVRIPNSLNKEQFKYSPLRYASSLMKVRHVLLENLLLKTHVRIAGESQITKRVTIKEAVKRRDALAKFMYGLLFQWIVEKLNDTLRRDGIERRSDKPFIGVLDVFGFERFKTNSFEQLLINYANEVLLSLFAKEVLINESQIYKDEGLVLHENEMPLISEATKAYDKTLELFEGIRIEKRVFPGILATIDSQQRNPQPSDKKLLDQLHKNFGKGKYECFPAPHPSERKHCFIVKHYANKVKYNITNFLQKNNQSLPPDLEEFFYSSHHKIVRNFPVLLGSEKPREASRGRMTKRKRRGTKASGMGAGTKLSARRSKHKRSSKQRARYSKRRKNRERNKATVAGEFSKQMAELKTTIMKTSCSYIRCVKPNPYMIPPIQTLKVSGQGGDHRQEKHVNVTRTRTKAVRGMKERKITFLASKKSATPKQYFDDDYVSKQLTNLGVYECVNVLKAGLPTRIPYPTFIDTFSKYMSFDSIAFLQKRSLEYRQKYYVAGLMKMFYVEPNSYKLGKTKIFFKSGQLEKVKDVLAAGGNSNKKSKKRLIKNFYSFYCKKLWRSTIIKAVSVKYFLDDLRTIRAVLMIQRVARQYLFHKKFSFIVTRQRAAKAIQCLFRRYIAKKLVDQLKAEKYRSKISGIVTDYDTSTAGNRGSKVTFNQDTDGETHWDELTLVHDADVDSVGDIDEEMSEYTGVGNEYNTLRPALKSYFQRRTTYNKKTMVLEKRLGKEAYKKLSDKTKASTKISFFSNHKNDSDWENMENGMLEFEGSDLESNMFPNQTVVPETVHDDVDNSDNYDSYDSDSYDSDFEEEELTTDNETGRGTLNTAYTTETKMGTLKADEDEDIKPNVSRMLRSKLARQKKQSKQTRASRAGKKSQAEEGQKVPKKLKIAGTKKVDPRKSSVEDRPYKKPKQTVAPLNRLNPKNSDFVPRRTQGNPRSQPAWASATLRKVKKQDERTGSVRSVNSTNTPVVFGNGVGVSKMAELFGGSTRSLKKRN